MRMLFKGEERENLTETDISRDEIPICVNRITSIASLKSKITQQNTLSCFGRELVLPRSNNMNKIDTTKDTRKKAEERVIKKNDRMRDQIMQNGGWHTINQITSS